MASTNPVPSRAALNALRGVLLTTSCSVILLAEERRQRLKIARAAIDNAKKLHTVRSNRGPIVLTESHGLWEGRYVDVSDDVLAMSSMPRPPTSTRRRRRSQLISPSDVDSTNINFKSFQCISNADRNHRAGTITSTTDLREGVELADLESFKHTTSKSSAAHDLEWKAQRPFAQPARMQAPPSMKQSAATAIPTSTETADTESSEFEDVVEAAELADIDGIETARLYLEKQGSAGSVQRPYYDEAICALNRLLADIETNNLDVVATSDRINLAMSIFERVAPFGVPIPNAAKPLRSLSLKFLQLVSRLKPRKLATVLPATLPLSGDPLKILTPFMQYAQDGGNKEALGSALEHLCKHSKLYSWMSGMLVYRLLNRYAQAQKDFEQPKKLYRMLQEAGLFQNFAISRASEFKIRRLMTTLALSNGDDTFATAELRLLDKLDASACKSDVRLQRAIILRKATQGRWKEACSDLQALGNIAGLECLQLQNLLSKLTDLFAEKHSPSELEAFLRKVVPGYNLKLKYRWIYAVLDSHASCHRVNSVFSWLQFCNSSGLNLDSSFSQRFFTRCRKYWSFSDKTLDDLQTALQHGGGSSREKAAPRETDCILSKDQLLHQMQTLSESGRWNKVLEIYDAACARGESGTPSCLRLAVLAHLKDEAQGVDEALCLIKSAHERGTDVSEALTPLLLARLERWEDPISLVEEAFRMGARIHDSAYNKAAQALSANGNHQAAAELCEVAARENGNGNIVYNEYNFANLIFAYTGLASYRALQSVLAGFTSDVQWWHGSRTCKESIKLAMKTTAMRTVVHANDSSSHRQALDKLDDALLHVKKCRSNKEHRRAISEAYVRLVKNPSALETRGRSHQKGIRGPRSKLRQDQESRQTTLPAEYRTTMASVAAASG